MCLWWISTKIEVADEGTVATDDHCGPLFEGTDYRTKKIKDSKMAILADFSGVKILINPIKLASLGMAPAGEDAESHGFVDRMAGTWTTSSITKGTRLDLACSSSGCIAADGRCACRHGRRRTVRYGH